MVPRWNSPSLIVPHWNDPTFKVPCIDGPRFMVPHSMAWPRGPSLFSFYFNLVVNVSWKNHGISIIRWKVMRVLSGRGSGIPLASDENRDKARSEGIFPWIFRLFFFVSMWILDLPIRYPNKFHGQLSSFRHFRQGRQIFHLRWNGPTLTVRR